MKRLILSFLIIAATTVGIEAQQSVLASDGTLFTVSTTAPEANHLELRIQRDDKVTTEAIPGSNNGSFYANPVIAHDPVSGSVFVFWLRHLGTMSSHLAFAYRTSEGEWSEPKEFGAPFIFREHLRMAVTGRVRSENGVMAPDAAISVHLAWWEFDSHTGKEAARYAMLPIEDGVVADVIEADLTAFVDPKALGPDDLEPSVLRQALMNTSATRDSVLITFGDIDTRSLHQVRFHPTKVVSDTRIRIPIGRSEGGIGAPRFPVAADARVEGIQADGGLVLYVSLADKLHYVTLKHGKWSAVRSIAVDAVTTQEVALKAIQRLAQEQ